MVGRRLSLNDSDEAPKVCMSSSPFCGKTTTHELFQFFKTHLVRQFRLEAPSLRTKGTTGSGDVLALLSFNYAYDPARISASMSQPAVLS